jgi:uncharacterized protein YegP (UPF0339 family)
VAAFSIEEEAAGAFRWRLVEGNGMELARSGRTFESPEAARGAIEELKRAVATATLEEERRDVTATAGHDDVVEQTFPASDPPSSWAAGEHR